MKTKQPQTFGERCTDNSKIPLHEKFIEWVFECARANDKTPDAIWQLWRAYSDACYDQSALTSEFMTSHGLVGTDMHGREV